MMSHIASRFATSSVTIWRPTDDEFQAKTWQRIGSFACTWSQRQEELKDASGIEFVASGVYYPGSIIDVKEDDAVAVGSVLDSSPGENYERVRLIRKYDGSPLSRGGSMMFATE